jgi:GTP cyclohydrolase II
MDPFEALIKRAPDHLRETGRPLVTLSYAQSLDGSISARRGEPLTLSGPQSLKVTHRLRAAHEAILVGVGTVLADDPRLTVRKVQGRNPRPLILDSCLRIPLQARLFHRPGPSPWIFTTRKAEGKRCLLVERAGARLFRMPADPIGRVHLPSILDCLGDLGLSSLMVEGGAQVITSFLAQGLADQVVLTIAPRFIGGLPAVEAQLGLSYGPDGEQVFPRLENAGWARAGEDLIVWGALSYNSRG